MSGEVRSIAPKKSQTTQSLSKKESKQSANSWEDGKSLAPPKEANDAIPVQKKGVKTAGKLLRKREVSRPPQKKQTTQSPSKKRSQNSRQTREKKQSLSLPTKKKTSDAIPVQKKVSKQSANSWEDAKSLPKRSQTTQSPSKKGFKGSQTTQSPSKNTKDSQNRRQNSWEDASLSPNEIQTYKQVLKKAIPKWQSLLVESRWEASDHRQKLKSLTQKKIRSFRLTCPRISLQKGKAKASTTKAPSLESYSCETASVFRKCC